MRKLSEKKINGIIVLRIGNEIRERERERERVESESERFGGKKIG